MHLTLNQIKKHGPCTPGWNTLLASLNKTRADDEPIHIMYILKSNGIGDAVWCLRCCDYKDYCLFLADVAESVLPYFERHNASRMPRKTIEAIRQYKRGEISQNHLKEFANATTFAAESAADNDYDVAADAAESIAAAASISAGYADVTISSAVDADVDALYDGADKLKFKTLFVKHFETIG